MPGCFRGVGAPGNNVPCIAQGCACIRRQKGSLARRTSPRSHCTCGVWQMEQTKRGGVSLWRAGAPTQVLAATRGGTATRRATVRTAVRVRAREVVGARLQPPPQQQQPTKPPDHGARAPRTYIDALRAKLPCCGGTGSPVGRTRTSGCLVPAPPAPSVRYSTASARVAQRLESALLLISNAPVVPVIKSAT